MKLIDEWKSAWRMFSVQAMALSASIQGAYIALPDTFQSYIPHEWMHYASIGLLVIGVLGRLIDQTPSTPENPKP